MSATPRHEYDARLMELLADQATGSLSDAERAELDALLGRTAERDLDAAIGGMLNAFQDPAPRTMPAELKARLARQGELMIGSTHGTAPGTTTSAGPSSYRIGGTLGWLAAAAIALVAAVGWWPRISGQSAPVIPTQTYAQQMADLRSDPHSIVVDFQAGPDKAAQNAGGRITWNNQQQKGFLSFKNLPSLDPSNRFQLWLFDANRADFPVDGGVFDIANAQKDDATGEFLVPVDAKLMVHQPTLFAVTIEDRDGVPVTKKERLVLVAEPPKSAPPPTPGS